MLPSKQTEEELDDTGTVEPSPSCFADISEKKIEDDKTSDTEVQVSWAKFTKLVWSTERLIFFTLHSNAHLYR